jgi:hypothetical protein
LLCCSTDLNLELVDRGSQRLLTVLDRALELPAHVWRHTTFSLVKSLSAGADGTADKAGLSGSRRCTLSCSHASTSMNRAG